MVVRSRILIPLLLLLTSGFPVLFGQERTTAGTEPVAARELAPRFAFAVALGRDDPALRLVADTVRTTIVDNVDAFFFDLTVDPHNEQRYTPADLSAETTLVAVAGDAWNRYQAEVLIAISAVTPGAAEADGGGEQTSERDSGSVEIVARYVRVPVGDEAGEVLGSTRRAVTVDSAGRYQRPSQYQSFIEAVANLTNAARPGRDVLIRSNGPFTIEGLPDYVVTTSTDTDELSVTLRSLRTYDFTLHRTGHRSESRRLYLERRPLSISVPLKPYPRHTVAVTMRNVSFPGIEYAYYPSSTRWVAHGGFTSFLFGLTPLRQLMHESDKPQLITSYGLTELEGGWQWLIRDRDTLHRFGVGGAVTARLVHGEVDFGLDPIIPGTLRLIGSWEWELPGRFVLTQRLSTDVFPSFNPEFLKPFPWMYKVGPVYWQLPLYRVGLRVRI